MERYKSISKTLEEVKAEMCREYCRYTNSPIPEGKDDGWMIEDDDSPCMECPLNRL